MPKTTKFYCKKGRRYVPAASYEFPPSPCDGVHLVYANGGGFSLIFKLEDLPVDVDVKVMSKLAERIPLAENALLKLTREQSWLSIAEQVRLVAKILLTGKE